MCENSQSRRIKIEVPSPRNPTTRRYCRLKKVWHLITFEFFHKYFMAYINSHSVEFYIYNIINSDCFSIKKSIFNFFILFQNLSIYLFIYLSQLFSYQTMFIDGGVRGVMVTVMGNEHRDLSSNPGRGFWHISQSTNYPGKGINPTSLSLVHEPV